MTPRVSSHVGHLMHLHARCSATKPPSGVVVGIRRGCMCAPFAWPGMVNATALSRVLDPLPEHLPDVETQLTSIANLSSTKQWNVLNALTKLVERSGEV